MILTLVCRNCNIKQTQPSYLWRVVTYVRSHETRLVCARCYEWAKAHPDLCRVETGRADQSGGKEKGGDR